MMLSRDRLALTAKLCISAVSIIFIINSVDTDLAIETATQLSAPLLILVLFLAFLQLPCLAIRWQSIVRKLDIEISTKDILRFTFIGVFFNQILPTSFGGDAVKAWYLHCQGAPLAPIIRSVIFDRIAALGVVILTVLASLPILNGLLTDRIVFWSLAIIVIMVGFAFFSTLIAHRSIATLLGRIKFLRSISENLIVFGQIFASRAVFQPAVWAFITLLFTITIVYLLAQGMGIQLTYWQCILVIPVVILGASVPISFAGWGIREGVMVLMLGYVGISTADALALSIVLGLVLMCASVTGGIAWLTARRSLSDPIAPKS